MFCRACGKSLNKKSFFNKYYQSSYIKSLFVILHSRKLLKILTSNEHKISLLTEFHKSKLISLGVYESNIKIIPNPIKFKKNISKKWSKELIYAGRISEEKGLRELINTFESSGIKDYTLKIIGDGPLFKKLQRNRYQNTKLLGRLDNETTLKHIRNSSIVVTTTKLYEGQPTILSEASSLGIPSIFPVTGGIEEFFPKNYEYSFVQFDYENLAEKIKLLISSENKDEVGARNYEFLKKKLEESQLKSTFEEIF
jgi:glycosyltransferase involved in cell wall biosynthesis